MQLLGEDERRDARPRDHHEQQPRPLTRTRRARATTTRTTTGQARKNWPWTDIDQKCCSGLVCGPAAPYASWPEIISQFTKYRAEARISRPVCAQMPRGMTHQARAAVATSTRSAGGTSRANVRP
nr:hypothetical protein GCM10025730_41130 [Promicromonospora thailandica]